MNHKTFEQLKVVFHTVKPDSALSPMETIVWIRTEEVVKRCLPELDPEIAGQVMDAIAHAYKLGMMDGHMPMGALMDLCFK